MSNLARCPRSGGGLLCPLHASRPAPSGGGCCPQVPQAGQHHLRLLPDAWLTQRCWHHHEGRVQQIHQQSDSLSCLCSVVVMMMMMRYCTISLDNDDDDYINRHFDLPLYYSDDDVSDDNDDELHKQLGSLTCISTVVVMVMMVAMHYTNSLTCLCTVV